MPKDNPVIHFRYYQRNRVAVCGTWGGSLKFTSVVGETTCLKCIRAIELADLLRTGGYARKP